MTRNKPSLSFFNSPRFKRPPGSKRAWDHFAELYLSAPILSLDQCWRNTRDWAKQHRVAWCSHTECMSHIQTFMEPAA